jgi:hypothetical protein
LEGLGPIFTLQELIKLELIDNPVASLPGYRELILSKYPLPYLDCPCWKCLMASTARATRWRMSSMRMRKTMRMRNRWVQRRRKTMRRKSLRRMGRKNDLFVTFWQMDTLYFSIYIHIMHIMPIISKQLVKNMEPLKRATGRELSSIRTPVLFLLDQLLIMRASKTWNCRTNKL